MPTGPKPVPLRRNYAAKPRTKTADRGYGVEHQKLRAVFLAEHPICQHCHAAFSTQLHHRDGNPFNRNRDNLEAVCDPCHHAHHAKTKHDPTR